jgi:hypothetical protein
MNTHHDLTEIRAIIVCVWLLIVCALAVLGSSLRQRRLKSERRRVNDRLNSPHFRTIHSPYYRTHK